jgi:hypothetical protein
MENNPVKQRVQQLTEMWNEAVSNNKEARVFAWVGASSVDYKMIRGFIVYHTSEESTIEDVFLCMHHPFEKNSEYGYRLIYELGQYITAWNNNDELIAQTGVINWTPSPQDIGESDEVYFIKNLNALADAIQIQDENNYLVIALLPQAVNTFVDLSNWLSNVLKADISEKLRLMVYDSYELSAFKTVSDAHPKRFNYLYPDLDMPGAMNQILETAKQQKKTEADREAVHFQQMLLKLTDAISKNEIKLIDQYKNQCIVIAQKYGWPHLEALVYFFMHSYYYSNNQFQKAVHAIDKSIIKADEALITKALNTEEIRYQYRIAKGNLFYINQKFADAAEIYQDCLSLEHESTDIQLLLGIYQMLGSSKKHNGEKQAAWNIFREGWALINQNNKSLVKDNIMLMLYGKEMIETGKEIRADIESYNIQMDEWWGENWMVKVHNYTPALN